MRAERFCMLLLALGVTLVTSVTCLAQEVGFVDLTAIVPRTEFRHPALQENDASRVRSGFGKVPDCSRPPSDAPVLLTTLLWLDRSEYQVGDEEKFEVQIENVGSSPIRIPFSPHVADLQPEDPGQQFAYTTLIVVPVLGGGESWSESQSAGSDIALYGADGHPDTMLTLRSGEWVQVVGKGKITLSENVLPLIHNGDAVSYANATVSIYGVETKLSATASSTIAQGTCVNQSQGPSVAVTVNVPK